MLCSTSAVHCKVPLYAWISVKENDYHMMKHADLSRRSGCGLGRERVDPHQEAAIRPTS